MAAPCPLYTTVPCVRCGGSGEALWPIPGAMRARRMELGLTLVDVSRLLGVTLAFLSGVERGKEKCPRWILARYGALKEKA